MSSPDPLSPDPHTAPFEADVARDGAYVYTSDTRLSSATANRRLTEAALSVADFLGRRVIDIGCGDGTYTTELVELGGASEVTGVDPAGNAIRAAQGRAGALPVTFVEASAYELPYEADAFELAQLRGVLHHVERPRDALEEALRVAPRVIVIEPNGYNPGLKVLERVSRYHVEHDERSYAPRTLDGWIEELGATVEARLFAGFVPMFCSDRLARAMKRVEPVVEGVPLLRAAGCAVYVCAAAREPARA